jgi:hypothetical protein
MQTIAIQRPKSGSRATLLTGRIISAIIILFLLADSIMKIIMESHYVDGTRQAGFSTNMVQPLGFILLFITVLYIVPRTAIAGALLLTAYLGGAVAIMMQQGKSFWFPVAFCSLAWIGLYFQNARLRTFFQNRKQE